MYSDFTLKLREFYRPMIEGNDGAHRMDHMDSVYIEARNINELMELNIPEKHIGIMAYCHDLFTLHRDNHHILGYNHIMTTNEWFMEDVDTEARIQIAHAILEHRASYKGKYTSTYSELLASADRGRPDSVSDMLMRSFKYANSKLNKDFSHSIVHAVSHIKEKFGSKGYTRYPELYLNMYRDQLDLRTKIIDKMIVPSEGFHQLKTDRRLKQDEILASAKELFELIADYAVKTI